MSKRIGIRELRREALKMGAAMVKDADFLSLFGDEIMDAMADHEDGDELMQQAQDYAAERILKLVRN